MRRRGVLETLAGCCAAIVLVGACSSAGSAEQSTTSVAVTTSRPPPSPTTEPVPGFVERTAAFVDDLALRDEFSGVALIARDEEVVWDLAAGLTDREADVSNHMGTRFNLGSMNKMFTAVAIMQLEERGLLTRDGTIADYLPAYPNEEVAEQVTVEHLLTHTSGLGDVFTGQFEADPHRFRSNADYLPLFVGGSLRFAPGERFHYSNAGYVVLGLIIEELSGVGYHDYVRDSIFEPSGMLDTGNYEVEEEVADLAVGYTFLNIRGEPTGVLSPNTSMMPGRGFAAGGGYSTAEDLLRFRNALLDGRLLAPESIDLLITGKVDVRDGARYAYGFFDQIDDGQRVVGHTGGAPGVCSFLNIYPGTGYTVVVLSNSDDDCLSVLLHLRDSPPSG
jgi:CubicO group peptidase (beta-lactamase class C family)